MVRYLLNETSQRHLSKWNTLPELKKTNLSSAKPRVITVVLHCTETGKLSRGNRSIQNAIADIKPMVSIYLQMDSPNFKFSFLYSSTSLRIVIHKKRKLIQKSMSLHFCYLMHNVAHKILISHTGQLQVYGNVSGDIGNGGHSLQGYRKREKKPTLKHIFIKKQKEQRGFNSAIHIL